jgi:sulfite exporter TauE/SafE
MNPETPILLLTALSIGFFHTLMGPDHYLPFIMIGRAQNWSTLKTFLVTVACGAGHVLSSIVIGFIGIAAGIAISNIEGLEGMRGNVAAYLLFGFGLAYLAWGIKKAVKGETHTHSHVHADGSVHEHVHSHHNEHGHVHKKTNTSMWWLFIIFVLGPCEPLIPILMYPAAKASVGGTILVALVFAITTIATMTFIVMLAHTGLKQVRFSFFEKYAHALGGAIIAASGAGMIFLGL